MMFTAKYSHSYYYLSFRYCNFISGIDFNIMVIHFDLFVLFYVEINFANILIFAHFYFD